jgi:hypothetical protein
MAAGAPSADFAAPTAAESAEAAPADPADGDPNQAPIDALADEPEPPVRRSGLPADADAGADAGTDAGNE